VVKSVTPDSSGNVCVLDTECSLDMQRDFCCYRHVHTKPGPTCFPLHWMQKFICSQLKQVEPEADHTVLLECQLGMCRTSPNFPYIFMTWCLGTGATYSEIQYNEQPSNFLSSILFVCLIGLCFLCLFMSGCMYIVWAG
jgi:hypothetical protein